MKGFILFVISIFSLGAVFIYFVPNKKLIIEYEYEYEKEYENENITYSFKTIKDFVHVINKERSKYYLDPIIRNYTIEQKIYDYSKQNNLTSSWYYTNGNYSTFNYATGNYKRWNIDHMDKYIDLFGFEFLFRDRTNRSIRYIMAFRNRQRECFDLNNCSNTFFNGSLSCLKEQKYSLITPYRKCSWAYNYYPKIIERNFTQIACVKFKNPPKNNNPIFNKEDKRSFFFCYGLINQDNDNPLD